MTSSGSEIKTRGNKKSSDIIKNESTKTKLEENKRKRTSPPDGSVGNATRSINHRIWTRSVMIISVMIIVYFYTKNPKEIKFAIVRENIALRFQKVYCSSKYLDEIDNFQSCLPKTCGRFVTDRLIETKESEILLKLADRVIELSGGSSGGASILDLHSGALSKGEQFINVYTLPTAKGVFQKEDLITYKMVKSKIKHVIADQFGIDEHSLYLTHPTFFSRITNETAKTLHDEYWHPHVDKDTYESFHYTSLLYLNNFNKNFKGGRFIFYDGDEKNQTMSFIEPKQGRVSAFTSGSENLHSVEKVTTGTRFALTISFTCNPKFAIDDPKLEAY